VGRGGTTETSHPSSSAAAGRPASGQCESVQNVEGLSEMPTPARSIHHVAERGSRSTPSGVKDTSAPCALVDVGAVGAVHIDAALRRVLAAGPGRRLTAWAFSSVGESARLITVRSLVRIQKGPPMPGPRGCSSAGRAPALQAGGRRFEPGHLHQDAFCSVRKNSGRRRRRRGLALPAKRARLHPEPSHTNTVCVEPWFTSQNHGDASSRAEISLVFCAHSGARDDPSLSSDDRKVKLLRAHGGCLGTKGR
jgi:hypothetical protein